MDDCLNNNVASDRTLFGAPWPLFLQLRSSICQNVAELILEHLLSILIQLQNTMWGYTKYNCGWLGAASVNGFQTF